MFIILMITLNYSLAVISLERLLVMNAMKCKLINVINVEGKDLSAHLKKLISVQDVIILEFKIGQKQDN